MCALEESGGGRVGRYGLVVFAFGCKGVCEADPGGAEVWVHHGRFGEEATCFCDTADGEVIDAYGEPGSRFVWVVVCQVMREQEERVFLVQLV